MKRNKEEVDNQDETKFNDEKPLKRKRKSRWGECDDESEKNILNGLPTTIPMGLTKEQEEQYLLQLHIEEITRRLRTGELGIPKDASKRSPSPEPIYGPDGKRVNTREVRVKKKLEEERHELILKVTKVNPDYKPPNDYKAPNAKFVDKVLIPQEDHPNINFIGLLLGPRGNTLKQLTQETGATIVIRGKGSVKEGKLGFKDGKLLPGQDEALHAYVTSAKLESVQMACEKIRKIIKEGIDVPDAENELRKQQLKELALLNGTLKDGDALSKFKQLAEAQTIVTNRIVCEVCGGAGHIANDCKQKKSDEASKTASASEDGTPTTHKFNLDSEYMSLMAELGQEVPQLSNGAKPCEENKTSTPSTPSSSAANQWQSCPPLWGNGYMAPPVPWGAMQPYNVQCYGPPPIPPTYGTMYVPPFMPPLYCGTDGAWAPPGYPPVSVGDWTPNPPQPVDQEVEPSWNPPPPTDDLPPLPPTDDLPPPPPTDDLPPLPSPPQLPPPPPPSRESPQSDTVD